MNCWKAKRGFATPFIFVYIAGAMLGIILAAACITLGFKEMNPVGVFESVKGEEPFYIEFFEDGTYRDSDYNMKRPFIRKGAGVTMYDAAGEATYFDVVKTYDERFVVHLNGHTHVMHRSKDAGVFFDWDNAEQNTYTQECLYAYASGGDVKSGFTVKLYTDDLFLMNTSDGRVFGKYAVTSDDSWLLLFTSSTADPIKIKKWDGGLALSPMTTCLTSETVKENAVTDKGFSLTGSVYDEETGVSYDFTTSNLVERKVPGAANVEMLYFVNLSGAVTMVDSAGAGTRDVMWYDVDNNLMYRHILENDKWYEYLNNAGKTVLGE